MVISVLYKRQRASSRRNNWAGMYFVHFKGISIYVFPKKELSALSPNFHIHVLIDLYFPRSVHLFSCSRIDRQIVGKYKSLTRKVNTAISDFIQSTYPRKWDCGAQFLFWEYLFRISRHCAFAVQDEYEQGISSQRNEIVCIKKHSI